MVNTVVQELAALLGLTDYESRAYLALLREGPLTGYAVAKAAGVPISKSYEAVEGLARKGGAVLIPGEPARHAPVTPDALLEHARLRHAESLLTLSAALADVQTREEGEDAPLLWRAGEKAGYAQAAGRIRAARRSVVGAMPPPARDVLESSLSDAAQAGVLVQIVGSGEGLFTLLLDDREAVLAALDEETPEWIGTSNPAVVAACRLRLRAASASPYLRPAEDSTEWLRWEEQKGLRLLRTGH